MSQFSKLTLLILFLCSGACSSGRHDISGTYRGILESPGGDLAFNLNITKNQDGYAGEVINGADTLAFSRVEFEGDSLLLSFDFYDIYHKAAVLPNGDLEGRWSRRAPNGKRSKLKFRAIKGNAPRYKLSGADNNRFKGEWVTTFTDNSGSFPATGMFVTEADGRIYGTFATETGDYRFLEGVYGDSTFIMSTYDGAHAFLFDAKLHEDGTLKGNFWSGDSYHATWVAKQGESELQDPMQIGADESVGKKVTFSFPDTDGNTVSSSDEQFRNKPLVVYLFGSWCPNCADEARLMREFYDHYAQTGVQFVGLAFEYSDNFEEDAELVNAYRARFDIPWTLLIAGTNSKQNAAEVLPFLDKVFSYPTSIFTDQDHTIKYVHVGFNGPATGSYYFRERERFKEKLDDITSIN